MIELVFNFLTPQLTTMENLHCIRCWSEMEAKVEFEKAVLSVCTNKDCLLCWVPQVGIEKLNKYLDKQNQNE